MKPDRQTCQNCKAFGGERIKFKGRFYGSCKLNAPDFSSLFIGAASFGEAWLARWPFVTYDDWCLSHVPGGDRTAVAVVVGNPTIID